MKVPRVAFTLIFLSLITSIFLNFYFLSQKSENAEVVKVIDGDSFETKDQRRVRLLSVDAPERSRCFYSESKEKLKSLILNKKVRLSNKVTDDYGRILANVFSEDNFINKIMLLEGFAKFTYASSPYYEELKSISQKSKDLNIGIYSPVCRTTSLDENCRIKANVNHGKKTFFSPSCNSYGQVIIDESFGDKWFCSEQEAVDAGFTKASNCN